MGYYFLLKRLEFSTERLYTMVVEENEIAVTDDNKKRIEAANDMQKMIEEMKTVFSEEKAGYEESMKAYEFNRENGYYDKGFGIIEGWFLEKIYLGINFRRYEEYFKILERVEKKLNHTIIKIRFVMATKLEA